VKYLDNLVLKKTAREKMKLVVSNCRSANRILPEKIRKEITLVKYKNNKNSRNKLFCMRKILPTGPLKNLHKGC
jgi:hypothetical protein